VPEGVRARSGQLLGCSRLERRGTRTSGFVGPEPVACGLSGMDGERGGERGVHAPPLVREQVGGERRGDQLMAYPDPAPDRVVGRARQRHREPLAKRFLEPGGEVAVQHPVAGPRAARREASLSPLARLVRGRHCGQFVGRERALRHGERTQDAATVRGSVRDSAQDELRQWRRQQRPGELTPGVEDLLCDQRIPTGSLRHEEEERGGWTLALVRLDERAHLRLAQRAEVDPGDAARPALDRLQGRPKRMRPGQCVGLVRPDEEERQVPGGSGQEGHEVARGRVDLMEILEEQDDRAVGGEPAQQAAQRLQGPFRAPLRAARPSHVDRRNPRDAGEERAEELRGRIEEGGHARWRKRPQMPLEGGPDGPVGIAPPCRQPVAPKVGERLSRRPDDPGLQLVEQPARAQATRACHEERAAAPCGHVGDGRIELLQLALTADEAPWVPTTRHSSILRTSAHGRA
jgi:hypothetical protein